MTSTKKEKSQHELATIRDTVESIWVAIVLAFVLRASMCEAFVIPTGSMAPLLLGEHWDITCPCCGYEYAHGYAIPQAVERGKESVPPSARCPNCLYPYGQKQFVNSGDRVLVLKYIYNFVEPSPWEVVVFRNPQNNQENYIKRLIGLPGEEIQIVHGDIYFRKSGGDWQIRRKEKPRTQESMWQMVFNNDYRPDMEMISRLRQSDRIDPPQWKPHGQDGAWQIDSTDGRQFYFRGSAESSGLEFSGTRATFGPRYGYNNTGTNEDIGEDVCYDLNLSFTFLPMQSDSSVSLMLNNFKQRFRGEVRADGTVTVYRSDPEIDGGTEKAWLGPVKIKPLEVGKGYELSLWHADYRVTLWVDGKLVLRSTDAQYSPDMPRLVERLTLLRQRIDSINETSDVDDRPTRRSQLFAEMVPTPRVAIQGQGGPCRLTHVKLVRDVYYTDQRLGTKRGDSTALLGFARKMGVQEGGTGFGVMGHPIKLRKFDDDHDMDEFFVLGDNSPQSLDGRAWLEAAPTLRLWRNKDGKILNAYEDGAEAVYTLGTVPRYNMIGRAMFVYWPSGYRIPGLPGLPIIPNVGKMRLIR